MWIAQVVLMIDHVREWRIVSPRDLRENPVGIIHQCLLHAGCRIEWETAFIQRRVFRYSPSMFKGLPPHHVERLIQKYGFRSIQDAGRDPEVEEGALQMLNADHLVWFLVDYFQLNEMATYAILTIDDSLVPHTLS